MTLIERLQHLRRDLARREGVEPYFVLHNATLEAIARAQPTSVSALQGIKGLGPKKIARYGEKILAVVSGEQPTSLLPATRAEQVMSVSDYIGYLNNALASHVARIRGEVGRVEARPQALYFDLRDPRGDAVLSCIVFHRRYELMGVTLEEGLEVMVGGVPNIYPRTGRLNFRTETIELVGEGKLQQAYRALKDQLQTAGLFDPARKRPIPEYAQRIGLMTSAHGAAIHDFTTNLTRVGLQIRLYDCRVEGARAVPELVEALAWFNRHAVVDVIVMARGGGSWESLQAFNNEAVCRAIAAASAPVLVGVGHERDVPLAALVADRHVSTPTATAHEISRSWREAKLLVPQAAATIRQRLGQRMTERREGLATSASAVLRAIGSAVSASQRALQLATERVRGRVLSWSSLMPRLRERFWAALQRCRRQLEQQRQTATQAATTIGRALHHALTNQRQRFELEERHVAARSPGNLLKRGWSVVAKAGRIVRSKNQLAAGDVVQLRFSDGGAESEIRRLTE